MAPLPVVQDCLRVRFHFTDATMPTTASFAMHFFDTAGTGNLTDCLNDIEASVTANMWATLPNTARVSSLSAIWLDGLSGTVTRLLAVNAKYTGGTAGDAIPQGAVVVSIPSGLRGPSKRNRIYLPWTAEAAQTAGAIVPSVLALAQAAWTGFKTSMNTAGWPVEQVSPKDNSAFPAAELTVRPNLKTMRPRGR